MSNASAGQRSQRISRRLRLAGLAALAAFATASASAAESPAHPQRRDTPKPRPAVGAHGVAPARGSILVASRSLADPNFAETVILLLQLGPDGAVGVVVNRPTDIALSQALDQLPEVRGRKDRLQLGGPVDPFRVLLLLRSRSKPANSLQIFGDIYVTGSVGELKRVLSDRKEKAQFRVFAGYAGWGPGQLEQEVKRGDWLVAPSDPGSVFPGDPEGLWQRLVEHLAGQWVQAAPQVAARAG